jgi:HSP20 family protein
MTTIIRRNPVRALVRFEPFPRPFSLLDEVEQMAREIFDGRRSAFSSGLTHSLDVYREEDNLVVKAELPGIKKKDLDISLEDDVLTIKAEKKQEEVKEDAEHYISERHFGQFIRRMTMPFPVDEENISATFKNGLLEMRLPKAEEAGKKRIEIKAK